MVASGAAAAAVAMSGDEAGSQISSSSSSAAHQRRGGAAAAAAASTNHPTYSTNYSCGDKVRKSLPFWNFHVWNHPFLPRYKTNNKNTSIRVTLTLPICENHVKSLYIYI